MSLFDAPSPRNSPFRHESVGPIRGYGLLHHAVTERSISPLWSACAVFRSLDGLSLLEPCGLFQPLTSMRFVGLSTRKFDRHSPPGYRVKRIAEGNLPIDLPPLSSQGTKTTTPTFPTFWPRLQRPPTPSVHGHVHRKMTSVRLLHCHEVGLVCSHRQRLLASVMRSRFEDLCFPFPSVFRPSSFVLPRLPVVSSRRGSSIRCVATSSPLGFAAANDFQLDRRTQE